MRAVTIVTRWVVSLVLATGIASVAQAAGRVCPLSGAGYSHLSW